jgi:hypothetical protein
VFQHTELPFCVSPAGATVAAYVGIFQAAGHDDGPYGDWDSQPTVVSTNCPLCFVWLLKGRSGVALIQLVVVYSSYCILCRLLLLRSPQLLRLFRRVHESCTDMHRVTGVVDKLWPYSSWQKEKCCCICGDPGLWVGGCLLADAGQGFAGSTEQQVAYRQPKRYPDAQRDFMLVHIV